MSLPFGFGALPHVSVIIPAFNAERTLATALASVFSQTYEDFEVVVVDDGSTDRTEEALAPWRSLITLVRQPNGGPGRARNEGIGRARGSLIAFLDADDIWLPEKLARQVEYFRLFPETGLLHTAAFIDDDTGVPTTLGTDRDYPPSPPRRLFREIFETGVEIHTLTVMASRGALDAVGGFDERREIHVEDWDLWLRIAAQFPVGYLRCPLAVRRPGGAMSAARERTYAGQRLVLAKALPTYRAERRAGGLSPANANGPLHRCAAELGYAHFERHEMAAARRAFREAIRYDPGNLRTRAYHLASYVPPTVLNSLRRAKRTVAPPGRARVVPTAPTVRAPARRRPLAHDTVYRRTRHWLADRAHAVDRLVHAARTRRRILFEASSPLSFAVFRPIYLRLLGDPRIEFCFTSSTRSWPAEAIFRAVGVTEHVIPASRAAWMHFDAAINTDFYDMVWLHRRTVRLQLFHGVAGKYGIDAPTHVAPDISKFDGLLFPNLDRLRRYLDAGLIDPCSAFLVGYPKVDCLLNGSLNRGAIARSLGLRRDVPTVLYAPTWSPESSLHLMGEAVIEALVKADVNVLVKLHDRSYDLTRRASNGIDWTSRLSVYDGHPRVRVVRDPDASPYLMVADALVTDHSSIGFEYALLDRPIVVLHAPHLADRARISPDKVAMLRAAAEVIDTPAELRRVIAAQLDDAQAHAAGRRRIAEEMFYRPGTATDRAVAVVYDAVGLEAPAATSAVRPAEAPRVATAARRVS